MTSATASSTRCASSPRTTRASSRQSASREAGNVTVFQKGWFTPCKLCEDNPDKPPAWRIRANEIIHRKDQATITYQERVLRLLRRAGALGSPISKVPIPTVKRKSGFLMPIYSHSDQLGTTVTVPYYFALSDHYDFTFAPMITEKAGTVLLGNWRHRPRAAAIASSSPACGTTDDPTVPPTRISAAAS